MHVCRSKQAKRFAVRATETASDVVEGDYDLVCFKEYRTRRDQGDVQFDGRRIFRYRPTLQRADRCIITFDALTAGRGKIKLELFGKRRDS